MSRSEVPAVEPRSTADLRQQAHCVLRDYYPDCLSEPQAVPIHALLEYDAQRDLRVDLSIEDLPAHIEAVTISPPVSGDLIEVQMATPVYEGLLVNNGRARFTAAHEFHHVIDHARQITARFEQNTLPNLYRRSNLPAYLDPEWQANRFAAELLMPLDMVKLAWQQGVRTAAGLARLFQVSQTAMRFRLSQILGPEVQP